MMRSKQKTRRAAELSYAAYADIHDAERIESKSTVAYSLEENGETWVAFRGSDDPIDWVHNFRAVTVRPAESFGIGGRLHAGILDLFWDIYPELPQSPDFVCGHSLGGALASMYAMATKAKAMVFGSPPIGSAGARMWSRKQMPRSIENYGYRNDVVWWLPRRVGLHHVGELLYIDRHRRVLPAKPSDCFLVDRAMGRARRPRRAAVWSHRVTNYLKVFGE